jgi:hypothetical protein
MELYSLFNDTDTFKIIKINRQMGRREIEEITKRIKLVKPEGKRRKGSPRKEWMEGVQQGCPTLRP